MLCMVGAQRHPQHRANNSVQQSWCQRQYRKIFWMGLYPKPFIDTMEPTLTAWITQVEAGETETAALPADLGSPGKLSWDAWEIETGNTAQEWKAALPAPTTEDGATDASVSPKEVSR